MKVDIIKFRGEMPLLLVVDPDPAVCVEYADGRTLTVPQRDCYIGLDVPVDADMVSLKFISGDHVQTMTARFSAPAPKRSRRLRK